MMPRTLVAVLSVGLCLPFAAALGAAAVPARGVAPVIVHPATDAAQRPPHDREPREIGIGRERGREDYRRLKQPRVEALPLGGHERFSDPNLAIPEAAQVL